MELYDIVKKLTGGITPTGDHGVDTEKLKNLGEIIELVENLLGDIATTAESKDRVEASMKKLGEKAQEFLDNIKLWLNELEQE